MGSRALAGQATTAVRTGTRIAGIDALRGLVMLVLLPDLAGGFSFYAMAALHPDSVLWRALGTQFTHAQWAGAHVWDFVMPVFVLLVGVSMPLSLAARTARGDSGRQLATHAAIRSLALVVLGLLLPMTVRDYVDDALPFLVIAALGLPVSRLISRRLGARTEGARLGVDIAWAILVLGATCAWMLGHLERLGAYNLGNILTLIGLAYFPAFLLARRSMTFQAVAALAVLAVYGAAFLLYAAATGGGDPWANGTNVAAAVDRALLNMLPRAAPYYDEPHGYHTLQFVPLIATLLGGMIAGRMLQRSRDLAACARAIGVMGAILVVAGGVLDATFIPLIKSLWTPSWGLFSGGVALLLLAGFCLICDGGGSSLATGPLTVLGSNAVLLYAIAYHDRWRIVGLWRRLLGEPLASSGAQPLVEALLVLATLWALAYLLAWRRIFIRL